VAKPNPLAPTVASLGLVDFPVVLVKFILYSPDVESVRKSIAHMDFGANENDFWTRTSQLQLGKLEN